MEPGIPRGNLPGCRALLYFIGLNVQVSCIHCGQMVNRKPSAVAKRKRMFCSIACHNASNRILSRCSGCARVVAMRKSYVTSGSKLYCSKECSDKTLAVTCAWPGCATSFQARRVNRKRRSEWFSYRPLANGKQHSAKYPLCSFHYERINAAFNGRVRLNSFFKIAIKGLYTEWDHRGVSRMMKFVLFENAGSMCQGCQVRLDFNAPPKTWQIDHIIPIYLGGRSKISNLQILCKSCHDSKTAPEKSAASRQRHHGHKSGRWLTHYEKDRMIETLRREVARLQSALARYVESDEVAG